MKHDKTSVRLLTLWQLVSVAVFFVFSPELIASGQDVERHLVSEGSSVVLSGGDDSSLILSEGRLTAIEGQAVRLLPGTHIRAGKQLEVAIVHREHFEALAAEAAQQKRSAFVASIMHQRPACTADVDNRFVFELAYGRGSQAHFAQQSFSPAVLPVRVQSSPTPCLLIKHSPNYFPNIENHATLACHFTHVPDLSWGKRAECIGVMLA